jgi:hypothetical protein
MLYLASFAANDISIIKIMYVYGIIVCEICCFKLEQTL